MIECAECRNWMHWKCCHRISNEETKLELYRLHCLAETCAASRHGMHNVFPKTTVSEWVCPACDPSVLSNSEGTPSATDVNTGDEREQEGFITTTGILTTTASIITHIVMTTTGIVITTTGISSHYRHHRY
jgi:hypothetical protein